VDNRTEVRDFLTTRRARISPAEAGVVDDGGLRRVQGLRRREVAELAGVSIEYYTRLERGNLSGVSESVLESVARALHLDEAERAHLFDLARAQGPSRRRAARRPQRIRPEVRATLDAFTGGPAFVRNGRLDVLAANALGHAVYAEMFEDRATPPNLARFAFLDERSWSAHNVKQHYTGKKHFHHPVVGDLYLTYQALDLFADQGLSLLVYIPQPDTGTDEALRLLASWAATTDASATAAMSATAVETP